jgi:hypothetical protein
MQAPVTDDYGIAFMREMYRRLAEVNASVAEALAFARTELYDRAVAARRRVLHPEYGIATLVAAGADLPLCDPDALPVPLARPTQAPSGVGVRELGLGEMIGRRAPLRATLRALRGDPASVREFGQTCGVVLTGVGGIGKSTLAGGSSLGCGPESTVDVVVLEGAWNPSALFDGVADATGHEELRRSDIEEDAKLSIVEGLLARTRLLLVFDDFERTLNEGGGSFRDAAFAGVFARLCRAARTGRLLVTSRYPVPDAPDLLRVEIPSLSRAELTRLLRRLPAIDELGPVDRQVVVDTIGGHPRLLEFVERSRAARRAAGGCTRSPPSCASSLARPRSGWPSRRPTRPTYGRRPGWRLWPAAATSSSTGFSSC